MRCTGSVAFFAKDLISFRAPGPSMRETGAWHVSLLTDYEATDVPGFGTDVEQV
jgi:hypothetical protein